MLNMVPLAQNPPNPIDRLILDIDLPESSTANGKCLESHVNIVIVLKCCVVALEIVTHQSSSLKSCLRSTSAIYMCTLSRNVPPKLYASRSLSDRSV
jgi:hypothetical protein